MHILAVDDSEVMHLLLTACLKGHKLDHAYNGQEALKFLTRPDKKYDVILLDWEMPIMDGPTTFKNILKQGYRVPVLMISARGAREGKEEILRMGINGYLEKPFLPKQLFKKIEEVLTPKEPALKKRA